MVRLHKILRKPPIRNSVPTVKTKGMALAKLGKMFKIKKYSYD